MTAKNVTLVYYCNLINLSHPCCCDSNTKLLTWVFLYGAVQDLQHHPEPWQGELVHSTTGSGLTLCYTCTSTTLFPTKNYLLDSERSGRFHHCLGLRRRGQRCRRSALKGLSTCICQLLAVTTVTSLASSNAKHTLGLQVSRWSTPLLFLSHRPKRPFPRSPLLPFSAWSVSHPSKRRPSYQKNQVSEAKELECKIGHQSHPKKR